jgi:hypothetical protein
VKPLKRLFVLVPDCHTASGHYRQLWRRNFYEGMQPYVEALWTPQEVDFSWARPAHSVDPDRTEADRTRTSAVIWDQIQGLHQQHGLDAVVSYCFSFDLAPELVQKTRQLKVPWINFFCDSTHMFEKIEPLARAVSLNWFPESAAISKYQALGVPYLCAPYAFSKACLPELTNQSQERTVAFVGLPTANRITQLGWLRVFGCPVEIRGHGWVGEEKTPFYSPTPRRKRLLKALFGANLKEKILRRLLWPFVRPLARGPLADKDFDDYVRGTLVILGLNQAPDAQGRLASYLKFRDVEFPGYSCCYLTEHHEDIPRVFEVGREILTFRSPREAASQVRRIRKQPELAREIGQAGRQRVLTEHNWGVRLQQLGQLL